MNDNQQNSIFRKYILKAILTILALFLVAGIAYGGWILFGEKRENSQFPNNVPGGEGSIESETPDLSSDWQWHSDMYIGYSIQYPKDFEFIEREESVSKESITLKLAAGKWKILFIYINAEKYPTEVTAREWADWYYPVVGSSNYTDITIGDMQGIKEDLSNSNGTMGEVILAKKDTVVKVRYSTEEVQRRDEVMELVNQIINTLQLD